MFVRDFCLTTLFSINFSKDYDEFEWSITVSLLLNRFSEKTEKPDTILIPFKITPVVREFIENVMNKYT